MLAVQWLSPCAAMAEVANEGRVLRVLFLADFVQTGDEYVNFSPQCDICLLAAPSLTITSVHGKRTLGIHSTVQLLALSGVHHVESCQVEETVLLSPTLCVVPYSTNPTLTTWVIRIVGGDNLLCFSCPKGPTPPARHYLLANTPALRQTVADEDDNGKQVLVVPIPKPYLLYLPAIVDHFPKTSVENTLPQSYLDALDIMGEPKSSAPSSRLVFVLAHEQDLFTHKVKILTDFFDPVAQPMVMGEDRIWLEGGREMKQLAQVVSKFVNAKATVNGLEISWPLVGGSKGKVWVLGRHRFRVECLDDLALGKRLAQHLYNAPDLYAALPLQMEDEVMPKRARVVEEVKVEPKRARTELDSDAQPLYDLLQTTTTKEILLSDVAHEGTLGDKKQILLLVKRFPAVFSLDVNSAGKRIIKSITPQ